MTTKRKAKFSIVTNEMEDAVYERLLKKVNGRELTPYIIELVKRDLNDDFNKLNFDALRGELSKLASKIDSIDKVQVKGEEDSEEKSLFNYEETEQINGGIDEDLDMDF